MGHELQLECPSIEASAFDLSTEREDSRPLCRTRIEIIVYRLSKPDSRRGYEIFMKALSSHIRERILSEYKKGKSSGDIANELSLGRTTVKRYLKNKKIFKEIDAA